MNPFIRVTVAVLIAIILYSTIGSNFGCRGCGPPSHKTTDENGKEK